MAEEQYIIWKRYDGGIIDKKEHWKQGMMENMVIFILLYRKELRKKILPTIPVNKGCHSDQQLQPPLRMSQTSEPQGKSGKKQPSIAIRLQPLPMVLSEETQKVKTQDTGPRELRCISKE